jgi:hypothetical protein
MPLAMAVSNQIGKIVGFTAIYALTDSSMEISKKFQKHPADHVIATTVAAAWVHAASTKSTANIARAILGGGALGLLSAPVYWLMFNSDWLEPKPKSILTVLREVVPQVESSNPPTEKP